jgi:hypothetical protein
MAGMIPLTRTIPADSGGQQSEFDEVCPEEQANWNLLLPGME